VVEGHPLDSPAPPLHVLDVGHSAFSYACSAR
jgi:hypothetical protein